MFRSDSSSIPTCAQTLREAIKWKKSVFCWLFSNPSPLLCLLTFLSINIYSEPTFPLGTVRPGTVLNPSPPRVSQTFTLSDVRILMASLRKGLKKKDFPLRGGAVKTTIGGQNENWWAKTRVSGPKQESVEQSESRCTKTRVSGPKQESVGPKRELVGQNEISGPNWELVGQNGNLWAKTGIDGPKGESVGQNRNWWAKMRISGPKQELVGWNENLRVRGGCWDDK